jgi:hypothetical protein
MATNKARKRTRAAGPQKATGHEELKVGRQSLIRDSEESTAAMSAGNPVDAGEVSGEISASTPQTELCSAVPERNEAVNPTPTPPMSLAQKYTLLSIQTFADCAVQKSPEAIFDVLARNFGDNGALSFWLHKVGHGHLTAYAKGHDIVDYIRKTSHELFRAMKEDVGRQVARW